MSSNEPTDARETLSRRPLRADPTAAGAPPDSEQPESLDGALSRARHHAQVAVSEAFASVLALLDAASLASSGELANANAILAPAARALEALRGQLGDLGRESDPLIQTLAQTLDAEIARWEQRARTDSNARSVLRAFLGLREVLWEFGIRATETPSSASGTETQPRAGKTQTTAKRKNVQRVTVEE